VFMQLYSPDLNDIQKSLLKQTLEELYARYNITWNTDVTNLRHEDFPTFRELYILLCEKLETAEKKDDLEYLSIIIRELACGSDSFLWNGHTTVNPKSKVICLDVKALENTSNSIKRAQYYNILTWAWEQMSRDRNEKVLLFCDEAHLLADPNVPQSLVFLRNVMKRARKYEAGVVVISQSVVDFMDDSVRIYAQAILDLPAYKIIMQCDGKNLKEIADLFNFTEAEYDQTEHAIRGQAIIIAGNTRMSIMIQVSDDKLELMGKSGGR